ncbi:MAG: J domain-containing protein [Bacilli bacterium]|nr:J domain-containing protein [Bacilli bacterium]
MSKNYYEILGISRNATKEEIKKAYRNKISACHPDLHPGDKELEEKAKEINEAYEVLYDDTKRENYDLGVNQSNNVNYSSQQADIFSEIVNQFWKDLGTEYNTTSHEDLIKEFDDFMRYLDETDEKFKEFNLTSEKMREKLKNQRGKLTREEINKYKYNIERHLEELKRNARYYDVFMADYEMIKNMFLNQALPFDEEKFINYTNPENRGKKPKEFYENAREMLFDLKNKTMDNQKTRYNDIMRELTYYDLKDYLYSYMQRNCLTSTLYLKEQHLKELEEFINTYKHLNKLLNSANMSLNDILKKLKKPKDTLTLEELKIIIRNVEEMKKSDLLSKWQLSNSIVTEINAQNSPKR